jgi:hypothetical protein
LNKNQGGFIMDYLIFVFMLFAHIIDDYYLQGILASMKQKSWWEKNAPDKLYKDDWVMALIEHALSWSISISIPMIIYALFAKLNMDNFSLFLLIEIAINTSIHLIVDNAKANLHIINLIQDQMIHIAQISVTFSIFMHLFM